jgi:hypothetical protein
VLIRAILLGHPLEVRPSRDQLGGHSQANPVRLVLWRCQRTHVDEGLLHLCLLCQVVPHHKVAALRNAVDARRVEVLWLRVDVVAVCCSVAAAIGVGVRLLHGWR